MWLVTVGVVGVVGYKPVKESFKKYGFCMWKTPEYECIIYPTLQAAQHAIQWTIEN